MPKCIALTAAPSPRWPDVQVVSGVWMSLGARYERAVRVAGTARLPGTRACRTPSIAAPDILGVRDRFKVVGTDTGRLTAQVVEEHSRRYRTHQILIGPAVGNP